MSLADRVTERPDVIHGRACSVAALLDTLDGPELAAFETMLYGKAGLRESTGRYDGWYERQIYEAVTGEGYKIARNQINQHRGKKCRCYR